MELQFNREPCLILEATELLYVFVNQLSPPHADRRRPLLHSPSRGERNHGGGL